MNSLSAMVLVWLFGTWAFTTGEIPPAVMQEGTKVTPIVIFASIFTTVGLAMFGLLGSWAIFLGIFRLRQNGNFFGARDGNESFFYPLRMVAAMALCAPVIVVDNPGGQAIVLTPGHSMIAGLAKSGSKWGDETQSLSFRLMHASNMFNEPNFVTNIKPKDVEAMLKSWQQPAAEAAGYMVNKNPTGAMAGVSPAAAAQAILVASWQNKYPDASKPGYNAAAGNIDPFISNLVNAVNNVPAIPPTPATAISASHEEEIAQAYGVAASQREEGSENTFCNGVFGQSWTSTDLACSDEMLQLRKTNTEVIESAIAEAQRQAWARLYTMAHQKLVALQNGGYTAAQEAQSNAIYQETIQETSIWYAGEMSRIIRDRLALNAVNQANSYFQALDEWGWMMGGTFVLRAANDFSRAQSYGEKATSTIAPQTKLESLTVGDDLTKIAMGSLESTQEKTGMMQSVSELFAVDILMENPAKANISTVSQFGRELAGTGLGILGAGSTVSLFSSGKISKAVGKAGTIIGFMTLVAGALIGYVMPIVFAIYGIMGVISWLTFVASAFFGVTLWSAAFAAPKGEEHTSQMAGKGWNMLIFIGLYPALAVGGLAAAVTITSLALPLVNILMGGIIGMSDNGVADLTQPLDALAGAIIGFVIVTLATAMLFWSVCMTSATLITTFPRTVLNMVSFSEPGLNPYENTSQGIMGNITGMVKMPLATVGRQVIGKFMQGGPGVGRPGAGGNP